MRIIGILTLTTITAAFLAFAQAPQGGQGRGGAAAQGGRGGGGGRGGQQAIVTMMLNTTAWPDGGMIPPRYTQSGAEISPAITWTGAPQGTQSFVLVFHDDDAVAAGSSDGILHWIVWNIPGTANGLPQAMPDGYEIENGIRQMSVSGSRYRGPGAPASGPLHHYVMELYALDTMLDIKFPTQGPQDANPSTQAIRTQIMQAMTGHIRGKASYVGLFHRPQ